MEYPVDSRYLHEALNKLVQSFLKSNKEEEIKHQFRHLNLEKVQRVVYKIASYGWYIDDFSKEAELNPKIPLRFIYSNLPEKMDAYFAQYYRKRIPQIRKSIITKHPERKKILEEAFFAHSNGLYHSSICLLITQIDGICDDRLEAKFFKNKRYLPEIKEKLDDKSLSSMDFLLSPIKRKAIINSWEKEIEKFPVRFNRHEIIHGVDINYGSEINSLKIISMISYLNFVLNQFEA